MVLKAEPGQRRNPRADTLSAPPRNRVREAYNAAEDLVAGALQRMGVSPYMSRRQGRKATDAVEFLTGAEETEGAGRRLAKNGVKADMRTLEDVGTIGLNVGPLAWGGAKLGVKTALRGGKSLSAKELPRLVATFETAPGKSGGHVPGYFKMSPKEQAAYAKAGQWDRGGRDALHTAAFPEVRQARTRQGTGAYLNSEGVWEHNPVTATATPVAPGRSKADIEGLEALRGLLDAQEASGGHIIDPKGAANGLLFPAKRMPHEEALKDLSRVDLGDYMVAPSHGGAVAFAPGGASADDLERLSSQYGVQGIPGFPGAAPEPAAIDSYYVPALAKGFDDSYNLIPSEPNTGEATMQVLRQLAGVDDDVTARVAGDRNVRRIIGEKIARDAGMPGAREDLQNTRRFFMDPRWNEALQYIRLGVPPATALAAVGYATSSLAGERPDDEMTPR